MRRRVWICAICALASSCARLDGVVADDSALNEVTSTTAPTAVSDTVDNETAAALAEEAELAALAVPGALILGNGIVVPVLHERGDDYSIRTPCGLASFVEKNTSITEIFEIDIVLDPGHGGAVETGAVGPNGLVEKDLNLDLAFEAQTRLEELGYSVLLTRTDDYRVPLRVRAEIANRLDAAVFVSIHHNAPNANPSPIPGTEIFVQSDSEESRRLGGLLYGRVVDALEGFDLDWVAAADAGALSVINDRGIDSYSMVRRPQMPAVLAEFAYISNRSEATFLNTSIYVDSAAQALADALDDWFTTTDDGRGHIDSPRVFNPNGLTGGVAGCVDPALD